MKRFHSVVFLIALASSATAQGKNLLFYGNSYSQGNGGLPQLVQQIATEAGHPNPTVVSRLFGGRNLLFHATDAGQVATISTALPSGQSWDHVVMQGQSTEATANLGNPAQFRTSAVAITTNVRNHSPAARAVLFQTWARGIGHSVYPRTFNDPREMHDQIRSGYQLAASDIDAAFGPGTAANAAVGDSAAWLEWDPTNYLSDLSHPGPQLSLLAGMCVFTSIYGQSACSIEPDFNQMSPLAGWLTSRGLNAQDWQQLGGIADRAAASTTRPAPGSGDHLLLESGTAPGLISACRSNDITRGSSVVVQMRSLNGTYDNAAAWLLVDAFSTGQPPGPQAMYPEIAVNLGTSSVLLESTNLANPLSFTIQLPFSSPGTTIMVQGLAWAPSSETGNTWFTTTDGHEFVFF